MPDEKMKGPALSWGLKNRHYAWHFIVHDDDAADDDDQDDDNFIIHINIYLTSIHELP
jgi:hypothetical protein